MKTIIKTPALKPADTLERWFIVDASGHILGRVATQVATLLRAKDLPTFTPHVAGRTHVVIINAGSITVTGNKLEQKKYYRHSTKPGSLKERTLAEELEKFPARPLEKAIARMLPDNRLRQIWLNHLHVYAGAEHPHQAQQPQTVTING